MESINIKYFIEKVINGLFFIAYGFFEWKKNTMSYPMIITLLVVLLVSFLIVNLVVPRMHFEPEDEMTRNHELRAQAGTYHALCCVCMVYALFCLIRNSFGKSLVSFNWVCAFFIFGILQIGEYIGFLIIERRGDPIE